jgi:hypothetical protein
MAAINFTSPCSSEFIPGAYSFAASVAFIINQQLVAGKTYTAVVSIDTNFTNWGIQIIATRLRVPYDSEWTQPSRSLPCEAGQNQNMWYSEEVISDYLYVSEFKFPIILTLSSV